MSDLARIYHTKDGWVIDTPVGLSVVGLAAAIEWHKKIIRQRMKSYSPEKREQHGKILSQLTPQTISQRLVNKYPWEQEKTMYLNNKE
jgi:hypothetical protein